MSCASTLFAFPANRNRCKGNSRTRCDWRYNRTGGFGGGMFDRRDFLSSLMAVAGAGTGLHWNTASDELLAGIPAKLPDQSLYDSNEEAYWAELRRQFLIPEDEVYLNNGTVGSSPAPVLRAVIEGYRDAERLAQTNPEDY